MDPASDAASDAARLVLELARSRPATLGGGRLVCVDGPAGSGKTTLAAALALLEPRSRVIHMDDLYDGWDGLPRLTDQLEPLLRPLASGAAGSYRRYDWVAGRYAETVTVEPVPLLVLEGVGSGARAHADLTTVLAWVWAPGDLRLRRGLERDGSALAEHWRQWMLDEDALFVREETARRADLFVDGAGEHP
ncbi:MAG TPA: 4-amino-4-deoxy-L-arabinose transferase [Nocardioides sp.]|nr:4-amino-4-deoxy-L-arabinose transferase [Nocardioides sp.]